MTAAKALLLGLIQGIAEFLPISSSGHLELFKNILGLTEVPLLFDVILHIATLLAVVVVMWKRIAAIFSALWSFLFGKKDKAAKGLTKTQKKKDEERRENLAFVVPILIATAITGILGVFIEKVLLEKFIWLNGPKAIAVRMLITALILGLTFLAKPGKRGPSEIGNGRAAFIGLAQGIGVFSGISRSGITISAGLFSGLDRGTAGELSFLLSIPAILGAFILTFGDMGGMLDAVSYGQLALAFAAAFFSGWAALKILIKVIKGGKIYWFAPYLVIVGILGLILG
ncbi:MAG TPA: undecaprenyl-diphosphate phosphatase [Rectinemataceae bacterium]|nr:undecaprenyl-diphosphate phosphatase [Rectinemataceae bacterium]